MTWYHCSANLTNGSTFVTGNGSDFNAAHIAFGDLLVNSDDGTSYKVQTVSSPTALTLATPFRGVTGSHDIGIMSMPVPVILNGSISNDVATAISNLITLTSTRLSQISDWAGGSAAGGPSSNGFYPITCGNGSTRNVPCPDIWSGYIAHTYGANIGSVGATTSVNLISSGGGNTVFLRLRTASTNAAAKYHLELREGSAAGRLIYRAVNVSGSEYVDALPFFEAWSGPALVATIIPVSSVSFGLNIWLTTMNVTVA